MIKNKPNQSIKINFKIDNKIYKKDDKLYFNGLERSDLVKFTLEGYF